MIAAGFGAAVSFAAVVGSACSDGEKPKEVPGQIGFSPTVARPVEPPSAAVIIPTSTRSPLVAIGTPTPIDSRSVNRALALDGRMDGLRIEDAEAFRITESFTIEARVRLTKREGLDRALNPSGGNAILSKKDAYGFFASHVGCSPSAGMAAQINNDLICTESRVPEGDFVHVAVTYDRQFVTFYLNGEKVAVRTKRDGVNINTQALFVGRSDTGLVTNAFGGEKDWVAMWNRAFSDEEIVDHSKGNLRDLSLKSGLVLYLPFDSDFEDIGKRYKVTPLGEPKLVEVK